MSDEIVDTNVLLVASAAHPYSPFNDTHLPPDEQEMVFNWLVAFRENPENRFVLDDRWKLYEEYRNKLTGQDYGMLVFHEKLHSSSFRSVSLDWAADEYALVPQQFRNFDRSDRKLLAAALTDPATIGVVNAADSDWLEIELELAAAGVRVHHIVEAWLRQSHEARP